MRIDTMDCEALINEVYSRRHLWDMSHHHHHHRGVLEKSWLEVSKRMNVSVKDARQKWKYLRDQFRKELRKTRPGESGCGYEPTWTYFHLLNFLKDQMAPRSTDDDSCSNPNEDTQMQSIDVKIESHDFDYFEDEVLQQDGNPQIKITPARAAKRCISNNDAMYPKQQKLDEETHTKQSTGNGNNQEELSDDYHFFMSLLPTMRKFNDLQKMRIRNKFQQAIVEELTQMEEYQQLTPRSHVGACLRDC